MSPRSSLFLESLIRFLLPYFLPSIPDQATARAEIIETLASYGARTRAETISAVQIVAFSFTSLDMLAEAQVSTEMSASMRLRYRGCANGLNRSTQLIEASLTKRQASDPPKTAEPAAEPVADLTEAEVHEAIQHARNQIDTYRARLVATFPATGSKTHQDLNTAAWSGALNDALGQAGMAFDPPSPG